MSIIKFIGIKFDSGDDVTQKKSEEAYSYTCPYNAITFQVIHVYLKNEIIILHQQITVHVFVCIRVYHILSVMKLMATRTIWATPNQSNIYIRCFVFFLSIMNGKYSYVLTQNVWQGKINGVMTQQ